MKKLLSFLLIVSMAVAISCHKQEDPPPVPYTTFKVNGIVKTYYNASRFTKDFCGSSTYCATFNYADNILPLELLKIGLPGDPVSGQVFKAGDYRFVFTYVSNTDKWYYLAGGSLKLTMTKWEGQGGWAYGQFSGTLKASDSDSIQVTDGYFQNWIWTSGTGK